MMNLDTLLVALGICVPFVLLSIWAILNAAQKEFGSLEKKIVWTLVAAIPFIGFIIYHLFGFKKGKKPGSS